MVPNGPFVQRSYDSQGLLTDVNLSGGVIADNLDWHPSGALAAWTSGNGYRTAKIFEPDTARFDMRSTISTLQTQRETAALCTTTSAALT